MEICLKYDKQSKMLTIDLEDGNWHESKMLDFNIVERMEKVPVIFQLLHEMGSKLKEFEKLGNLKWNPYPKTFPEKDDFYIVSCRCGVTIAEFRFGKFDTLLEIDAWMPLPTKYESSCQILLDNSVEK